MRVWTSMCFALALASTLASGLAQAQPAVITVADCTAFEITDEPLFCCYVFTLCIENVALPPIDAVEVELLNAEQCTAPAAPDGWDAGANGPSVILWEAGPGDELPAGVTLCAFSFSSNAKSTDLHTTLMAGGAPVFETTLSFTCGDDCPVPVEPGSWGQIKAIYTD